MSNQIVCNKSNEEISPEKWQEIQEKARNDGMLDQQETLKERIEIDKKTLQEANITFTQINDFFHSVKLAVSEAEEQNNIELDISKVCPAFVSLPRNGWCLQARKVSKITLFGIAYIIAYFQWGGSASCPFHDNEICKSYRSFGSGDFIFYREDTKEAIHIGSLLFHQIATHHFFQSPSSAYRADPSKLIQFFNLTPYTNYKLPTVFKKVCFWYGGSSEESTRMTCKKEEEWKLAMENDKVRIYRSEKLKMTIIIRKEGSNNSEIVKFDEVMYHVFTKSTTFRDADISLQEYLC